MPTVAKLSPRNRYGNLREMLLAAGVGNFAAPLAIQFMSFLPRTCDAYAQGTIILVQGMQRLLNSGGAKLRVDGGMGDETVAEIAKYAGPRWYDKSWQQLYTEVLAGQPWPGWKRRDRSPEQALAGDRWDYSKRGLEGVAEFVTSPPGLILAAIAGIMVYDRMNRSRRAR